MYSPRWEKPTRGPHASRVYKLQGHYRNSTNSSYSMNQKLKFVGTEREPQKSSVGRSSSFFTTKRGNLSSHQNRSFNSSSVLVTGFVCRISDGHQKLEAFAASFIVQREGEREGERAMSLKSRGGGGENSSKNMISKKWTFLLCLGSFCVGLLFTNRCNLKPNLQFLPLFIPQNKFLHLGFV